MLQAIDHFSPKQLACLRHGQTADTLFLAGGAVRSGKTFSAMLAFVIWAITKFPGKRFVIAGVSIEAVRRNCADDALLALQDLGFHARMHLSHDARIAVPTADGVTTFHMVGAHDEKAAGRIQGMTIAGALVDEVVLIPKSFVMQLFARMSFAGAKAWLTYNPANPGHWFKREIVDDLEKHKARAEVFTLDDNPALAEEVKDRYRSIYAGHFRDRFIDGKWAAASGLIYPEFRTIRDDWPEGEVDVGLDWGVSSILAAIAFQRLPRMNGGTPWAATDELYHDARTMETLTEDQTVKMVLGWLAGRTVRHVWVDPATPVTFKRKLRAKGLHVRNADNDVLPGIVTTGSRLKRNLLVIHERCDNLLRELAAYTWDADKAEAGEDAPVKGGDHACDALRYFAHSTGKHVFMHGPQRKPMRF